MTLQPLTEIAGGGQWSALGNQPVDFAAHVALGDEGFFLHGNDA